MEIKASEAMKRSCRRSLALKLAVSAILFGGVFVALLLLPRSGTAARASAAAFPFLWLYLVYSYTIYHNSMRSISSQRVLINGSRVLIYRRKTRHRSGSYFVRHIFYEPIRIKFSFSDSGRLIVFGIVLKRECLVRCSDLINMDDITAYAEKADSGTARFRPALTIERCFSDENELLLRKNLGC